MTAATLTDEALDREIARLEAEFESLDAGYWPSATSRRAEVLEQLDRARVEKDRRRT